MFEAPCETYLSDLKFSSVQNFFYHRGDGGKSTEAHSFVLLAIMS
jgi:hypothetical protein